MQFLVYLTVLMVAISTVLLEVHWLTSPAPQPKPAIQASAPPPPKTEGPNQALSPVYPKKLEASRPGEPGNPQAPNASPDTVQTPSPTASGSSTSQQQSAVATMVAPAQPLAPPAQATQPSPPPPQSQPAQQPATAQTTRPVVAAEHATPPQQTQTALSREATPQPSGANAAPQQKPLRETTGAALREDNIRQAAADPGSASSRNDNQQQTAQSPSSNRCDVQACASTYRSFRASDCTYQPFDGGVRRLCEKSPGQRMARERGQPERPRWSGDSEARYVDRPTTGRRVLGEDEDVDTDFDDARREPLGFFLFGRRSRW